MFKQTKFKLSDKAEKSVKSRIKKIIRHSKGISLLQIVKEVSEYRRGWIVYYWIIETPTVLRDLESWIRRRVRCYVMKQWIKQGHT